MAHPNEDAPALGPVEDGKTSSGALVAPKTLQLAKEPSDVKGSISDPNPSPHAPYAQPSSTPHAPPPDGKPLPYESVVHAAATHVVPQNPPPSGDDAPCTLEPDHRQREPFSPPVPLPRDPIQEMQESKREQAEDEAGREHNLGRKAGEPGKEEDVRGSGAEADVKAGEIRELEKERRQQPEPLIGGHTLEDVDEMAKGQRTPTPSSGVASPAPVSRPRSARRSMTDSMAALTDDQKEAFAKAFGSVRTDVVTI